MILVHQLKQLGESTVTPCDALILATGYKVTFPFISDQLLPINRNKVRLYKWQFIPTIKHPHTLAFISLAQPIGALLPIGELQSRWFALLMAGKLKLPSRDVMEVDITQKERFQQRFYESERHTIQVDWLPFMDELASEIGAYPPVWRYLFTDFHLFRTLVFGANAPYQYRLVGPNQWPGAREALFTIQDRIDAALNTNKQRKKLTKRNKTLFTTILTSNSNIFSLFIVVTLITVVITSMFSIIITTFLT